MIDIYDLPQNIEVVEISEAETAQITGGAADSEFINNLAPQYKKESEEYLANLSNLSAQLNNIDSAANPETFAQLIAQYQAESKSFALFNEGIAATIESRYDQLSLVRK